mmetsp:Transcript_58282/g.126702  ORF Transcript_58282/g.126702 Transcript_58282/m.126702 type:complete len:83 (-) Transcript_58282:286-534(-)
MGGTATAAAATRGRWNGQSSTVSTAMHTPTNSLSAQNWPPTQAEQPDAVPSGLASLVVAKWETPLQNLDNAKQATVTGFRIS